MANINDLYALRDDLSETLEQNRNAQALLITEKEDLLAESRKLWEANKDLQRDSAAFRANRARMLEIKGVPEKHEVEMTRVVGEDDNGSEVREKVLDKDGNPIMRMVVKKDDKGRMIMKRPGLVTRILDKITGVEDSPGLYQEHGRLTAMLNKVNDEIAVAEGTSAKARWADVDALQERLAAMGLAAADAE